MQPVGLKIKHNVALLLSVSFLPCFLAYGITPQTPKEDETAVVAEADTKEVAGAGGRRLPEDRVRLYGRNVPAVKRKRYGTGGLAGRNGTAHRRTHRRRSGVYRGSRHG